MLDPCLIIDIITVTIFSTSLTRQAMQMKRHVSCNRFRVSRVQCDFRERCKWQIVTGNHWDDDSSFTYLSQAYRTPVKCHLSPCDWDRKPDRAICHKHPFGILKKVIFEVSLLLILILVHQPTQLHMGKHTHTSSIFEGLHSPFSALTNSLDCRLLHIFPFQNNWGILKWFVFIFPFFLRLKA